MMSDYLLNCLITLTFIASVKAIIFKSTDTLIDKVTVQHTLSRYDHRHRRSTDEDFPVEMHFQFSTKGSDVSLRLKRSLANEPSDIPVYVIRRNGVVKENLPPIQNAASYLDKGMGAAVLVRRRTDGNFTIDGTYYDSGGRVNIHHTDGPVHEISRAAEVNYGNDFILPPDTSSRSPVEAAVRTKRRSVNEYTIGILMCADYKDYSHWKKHFKNETLVKNGMRQYYAVVAQSMSLRYDSVTDMDPNLKINIHITGLLIVDNPGKSYWTENGATADGTVEVKPALRSFKDWVRVQSTLPPSDHWMLFSGYDLTSNGSTIVAGLATLAAMCTPSSVSIIEQDFSASVGATAAHELGHCLSAFHDGSRMARRCRDSDNYIMSSKLVNPTENATASRPWEFSSCSVRAFRRYLARVYCARKPESSTSPFNTREVSNLKPGQVYSSDIQCRLALGNQSYFGRAIQYDRGFDTMCRAMYCAIPGRPSFFQKMFAMEKTTCGDGKWCIKGRCTANPEAPRTPENCPQGDSPGEDCKLQHCPFLTQKGRVYCCRTCGITPKVELHTIPPVTHTTTTRSPSVQTLTEISAQSPTPSYVQPNPKPKVSTSSNFTNSKPPIKKNPVSILGNTGRGNFAIVSGVFPRFRSLFDRSRNGNASMTPSGRTGNESATFITPSILNTSSDTPNVGSWLSQILQNAKPSGAGPTTVKFISLTPRPTASNGGAPIFGDQNGFSWTLSDSSSPFFGGGLFDNSRQSTDVMAGNGESLFSWINNPMPISSTTGSDARTNDRTPPRIVFPSPSGRLSPRWRSAKPIQRNTETSSGSSDSITGINTIIVRQTGSNQAFCVSCAESWISNPRVITRPGLTISTRPSSGTGISWLRRSAIRSVAGTNINNGNFRKIVTIPRWIQG